MIHALQMLVLLAFPVLVIVGGLKDLTSYTIPNWIPLALMAAFPLAAIAQGLSLPLIGLQLAVGVAALFAGMAMFALRWIGGGDAKLFAAAGLWLGWPAVFTFAMVTGLCGGHGGGRGSPGGEPTGPSLGAPAPLHAQRPRLVRPPGRAGRKRALRRGHRGRGPGRLPDLPSDDRPLGMPAAKVAATPAKRLGQGRTFALSGRPPCQT